MMLRNWMLLVLLWMGMSVGAAHAQSEDDGAAARALLTEAVEYYKENGDKALAVFSRQGPFVKDDLYVFAINTNGIMLASGGPSVMLIGRDIMRSEERRVEKVPTT